MRASAVFSFGESSERIVSVVGFVHGLSVSRLVFSSRLSPAVWVIGLWCAWSDEFTQRSGWLGRVGVCGRDVLVGWHECWSWAALGGLADFEVCVWVDKVLRDGPRGKCWYVVGPPNEPDGCALRSGGLRQH